MDKLPIDIPTDAIKEVCKKYYVKELALFGSVLGPDFRPESDIDVLVEFEPGALIGFLGMAGLMRELSGILGREVDLVPKAGLKRRIRRPVLDSAQVIYAG
ncbi:MAG: nucleotidyltransferase family protein [Armatimonadetes bacterium]|nr:nucleotidyltransferase family protein [Armatimonadota bacterium]